MPRFLVLGGEKGNYDARGGAAQASKERLARPVVVALAVRRDTSATLFCRACVAQCVALPKEASEAAAPRLSAGHPDAIINSSVKKEAGMSNLNFSQTERIEVRASSAAKLLLQEAARVSHKSVSEFLLDAGITAAHQAMADRRHFILSDAQWDEFQQVLERPAQTKPRLKNLLSTPGVLG